MHNKPGVLLGAWLVVNLLAYRLVVRSGWPMGSEAPAEIRVDLFDRLPAWLGAASVALVFLLPVVLVPAWLSLERRLGIDSVTVAAACRWCLAIFRRPLTVAIVLAVVVMLLVPVWFTVLPAIVFLALLPLGVFDARVAASESGSGWWRPRWPGWQPLAAVVALFAIVAATELTTTKVSDSVPPLAPFALIAELLLAVAVVTLQGSILLSRLTPRETVQRLGQLLSWRQLGPVLAVHARLLFVAMFVLAPVVAGAVMAWTILPTHAAWAESRNELLPWPVRLLTVLATQLDASGVLVLSVVLGLPLLLTVSRVLWAKRDPEWVGHPAISQS